LNQEIAKALGDAALQANLRGLGIEPKAGSPDDLKAAYRADQAKWAPVIERAGIQKQ
jgi:tripartite-type tricarboxylate transporter receptor subunit TctC